MVLEREDSNLGCCSGREMELEERFKMYVRGGFVEGVGVVVEGGKYKNSRLSFSERW